MSVLLHSEVAHFVMYIAASAAIGAMPGPGPNSSTFYKWLFAFLNTFAANFTRAFSSKVGQSPLDPAVGKPTTP